MDTTQVPPDASHQTLSPTKRLAQLLHRTMTSQAVLASAFEMSKVSALLQERITQSHIADESGLRALVSQLKLPDGFDVAREIPLMAQKMAKQSTVNLETIISAATIILSHSTADDVFTGACEASMELAPNEWISELNLDRKISLRSLTEKGSANVLADELKVFRSKLGAKSLPARAELLFRHVSVRQHKEIPPTDPAYFRMSKLRQVDDLRHLIVHGSGLPQIERTRSNDAMLFLHEAALVALRSVVVTYGIPDVWTHLVRLYPESSA
jgi:hypothetical protein